MKSSRAMLLAAMLFVAPAFADDQAGQVQGTNNSELTQDAPKGPEVKAEDKKEEVKAPEAGNKQEEVKAPEVKAEDKKEEVKAEDKKPEAKTEQPSWFAAKLAVLTGLGTTVANYTVTPVADWTTIPALKQLLRISYLKGGRFESSIPTVGKSIIVLGAAAAAYKIYQATQDQDETDEDDVFGE